VNSPDIIEGEIVGKFQLNWNLVKILWEACTQIFKANKVSKGQF
jgi:hypothetical protein